MKLSEFQKEEIERKNKLAISNGKFTQNFESRAQRDRRQTTMRKQRLRELISDGVIDIDVLAQHFMISSSTMRGYVYMIGERIKDGKVLRNIWNGGSTWNLT